MTSISPAETVQRLQESDDIDWGSLRSAEDFQTNERALLVLRGAQNRG